MAEQRELGHDVGEVDDPARASLWGPIGGNGVREKTLFHRPLGLLPCDVTDAAVDDCLAAAAGRTLHFTATKLGKCLTTGCGPPPRRLVRQSPADTVATGIPRGSRAYS